MLAGDFTGIKLYKLPAQDKRIKKDGTTREPKKVGKIHYPVFTPEGTRVVGFMLRLPDIAGMVKQPDRFIAYDAIGVSGDVMVAKDDRAAFDNAAAKRLGINLDACLIWTGMDVRTTSGKPVGYCADVDFNGRTGEVLSFILTEGGASNALVGHREMPPRMLKGYRDGAMVVSEEALDLAFSGGAAAKAAEVGAKAKVQVKKGAAILDDKGSKALDKGSKALGKQLGKTKGMFGSFVSEYKKAAGTSSSAKKKAPSTKKK